MECNVFSVTDGEGGGVSYNSSHVECHTLPVPYCCYPQRENEPPAGSHPVTGEALGKNNFHADSV